MSDTKQLFENSERAEKTKQLILGVLRGRQQPSASELLLKVENAVGLLEARWELTELVESLAANPDLTQSEREYLWSLVESGSLAKALRGEDAPDRQTISTIDLLLQQSKVYNTSKA
ncbi:MAG: hypothetical protein NTU88_01225, partial [Armatimonadetes bacterium]|nr:hypothetical protein [Armatimonadota bacterium]